MKPVKFEVHLVPSPDAVAVSVATPDGEVLELGEITSPAGLLGFGPTFAAYMATLVSVSVMQCREG